VIAQKLCDQVDQALANHDLNQILGFYDSTYVFIDERGNRVPFPELRKNLKKWFPRATNINQSTRVKDVKLEAGRMVVYTKVKCTTNSTPSVLGWVPRIVKVIRRRHLGKKGWPLETRLLDLPLHLG